MESDGLIRVSTMSVVMFASAMLGGYIPVATVLPRAKVLLMSSFGCGVLLGVALVIVIPEGVSVLTQCQEATPPALEHIYNQAFASAYTTSNVSSMSSSSSSSAAAAAAPSSWSESPLKSFAGTRQASGGGRGGSPPDHDHSDITTYIGLGLLGGYVFQFLVDRSLSSWGHAHAHKGVEEDNALPHVALMADAAVEEGIADSREPFSEVGGVARGRKHKKVKTKSVSAFVGLLLHAATDGIALGASSVGSATVGFAVFVAVIFHKVPASFGLGSYLVHLGVPHSEILRKIFFFSIASPVTAMVTYLIVAGELVSYSQCAVGLVLEISAGSFLYVATGHILPDIQASESAGAPLAWPKIVAILLGMLTAVIVSMGHGDD